LNEILREYNDLGMLTKEYQEHEGAKDSSTLYVEHAYDDTAASGVFTKGLRLKSVRYPNGRLVHFTYGSSGSMADNLARLDAIKDDSAGSPGATLASYTYVGLGLIVVENYEEPDVKLDYFGGLRRVRPVRPRGGPALVRLRRVGRPRPVQVRLRSRVKPHVPGKPRLEKPGDARLPRRVLQL
jgi:hypothetical protein